MLGSVTLELDARIADSDNPGALATDEAHVRLLAVAPVARRLGVGRTLMEHCAAVARDRGKARLTLNTSQGNIPAQRFYEAIGFVRLPGRPLRDGSALCSYERALPAS